MLSQLNNRVVTNLCIHGLIEPMKTAVCNRDGLPFLDHNNEPHFKPFKECNDNAKYTFTIHFTVATSQFLLPILRIIVGYYSFFCLTNS